MTKNFLEMTTEEREYQLDCANTFLKWTREDIKDVTKSFFRIGFRLYEARAYKYYEALGYPDIETLAEEEFGFKRSTTYGFIQVYENTCTKYGHNTMDERFIGYDYTKLLELCKVKFARPNILSRINPTDSVRDIRQYVKFWNEYTNKHSTCPNITLQGWKAQQVQITPALPALTAPIEGQLSIEDTIPDEPQNDITVNADEENNVAPTVEPSVPVQTFGQPTCAEPEQTETIIKPKKEKPIYNLKARDGIRAFLKDYKNWQPYFGFIGSFFKDMFFYSLKNGVNIYACGIDTLWGNGESLETKIDEIIYFINNDKRKSKKITKEQFERYCAEHKDEL